MSKMHVSELAREIVEAQQRAGGRFPDDEAEASRCYGIWVFLQPYDLGPQWGPAYTVHCDQSYGGSDAAEAAVREELPNAVLVLDYDEDAYEDVAEALEAAMKDAA